MYSGLSEQITTFAGLPQPVVVVFQDLDDPPAAATFGEVMATTYKQFGAAGLVTSEWDLVGGRRRRTYQLTPAGRQTLASERDGWTKFATAVSALMAGGPWPATR